MKKLLITAVALFLTGCTAVPTPVSFEAPLDPYAHEDDAPRVLITAEATSEAPQLPSTAADTAPRTTAPTTAERPVPTTSAPVVDDRVLGEREVRTPEGDIQVVKDVCPDPTTGHRPDGRCDIPVVDEDEL